MNFSDNTYYALIIVIIIGFVVYNYFSYQQENKYLQEKIKELSSNNSEIDIIAPRKDIILEYDYKNLYDPLKQPCRRLDRDTIYYLAGNPYLNIPTRGYPDNFTLQGYLVDDSTNADEHNKILRLFGRSKYPGNSIEWEYFVEIDNGHGDKIKFELHRQHRELYDDDSVYVSLIKRNYTVKLLRTKTLEYNAFLF